MLAKHIIGYIPSLLVPALASFGAIYCYTRLLNPAEYGHYALALNSMTLLNAVFFYWLQMAIPRLMPAAIKAQHAEQLRATAYVAFAACSLALLLCTVIFIKAAPLGDMRMVIALAVPLALVRSLLNLNQAFHRSVLDFKRYNIIECGQAVIALGMGLLLVYYYGLASAGALLGVLIGLSVMALYDAKTVLSAKLRYFSRPLLVDIIRFGLPLVLIFAFTFITSTSDRFLIEHYRGAAEVGIYAAGYNVMDRIAQLVFMMVATPSFPLLIDKLEHEGVAAAKEQTYDNGIAILALGMPACAGLMLCNAQLATVLIGAEFRDGAMRVMPWIAVSTILNGLSTHYFDHAFHLAKKPYLLFFTQGPAALFNLVANIILIPRYGYMGAAYSTVASYALVLVLSIAVGRSVFAFHFPWKAALQIAAATALMALCLHTVAFPVTMAGLLAMALVGGLTYGVGLLAFNMADSRTQLLRLLKR